MVEIVREASYFRIIGFQVCYSLLFACRKLLLLTLPKILSPEECATFMGTTMLKQKGRGGGVGEGLDRDGTRMHPPHLACLAQ